MKKIKIFILSLFLFSLAFQTHAQIAVSSVSDKTTFDTQIISILKNKQTDEVQFNFEIKNISNPQRIGYWRVISYCDEGMTVQVGASTANNCGSAVRLDSLDSNSFPVLFLNNTDKIKKFYFKIKAYEPSGKWLSSQEKAFWWK